MVIAAYVQHLIPLSLVPSVADAVGPMPNLTEVGELLRVQVEQVSWSLVLVAVGWLLLLERGSL
jgi:hypothetical protein